MLFSFVGLRNDERHSGLTDDLIRPRSHCIVNTLIRNVRSDQVTLTLQTLDRVRILDRGRHVEVDLSRGCRLNTVQVDRLRGHGLESVEVGTILEVTVDRCTDLTLSILDEDSSTNVTTLHTELRFGLIIDVQLE